MWSKFNFSSKTLILLNNSYCHFIVLFLFIILYILYIRLYFQPVQ